MMTGNRITEAQRQAKYLADWVRKHPTFKSPYGAWWKYQDIPTLVRDWIEPAAKQAGSMAEIGVGGGKWTELYAHLVNKAYLIDGTTAAEDAVLAWLDGPFEFIVSEDGCLCEIDDNELGWVWSFDTFVHFHPELFNTYLEEISRVLRPNGILHLHHAVPWGQIKSNGCFQYRTPSEIDSMLVRLDLLPARNIKYHNGYGSRLVEAIKVAK